jgi:mono/diheme cytochrome c family protein
VGGRCGAGLTAVDVEAIVAAGHGVMPAGVVEGQDAADVAAYVATLSQ